MHWQGGFLKWIINPRSGGLLLRGGTSCETETDMEIVRAHNLVKTYPAGDAVVEAVRGVSLVLEAGNFVAVMGPSGCGKSTLLHLCGAMDRPTSGELEIDGLMIGKLDEKKLTRLRRDRIGFVFQFFNLLPTLTVVENIGLPLMLAGVAASEAAHRAGELAQRVGLAHRLRHFPRQLSGGEMQRAAIARAIIHRPALVVADEPTGNLDSENGANILRLLADLNTELGVAILLATHDRGIAASARCIVHMVDGQILRTEAPPFSPILKKATPIAPF